MTYLHGDHLGSTSKTTGAASSSQLYDAYGAKRGSSEVDTPYRYTGQRWEENDALDIYYYRARWYDPALGRFLQPDPFVPEAGNPQNLNRYSYTLNNPLRHVDPTGYDPLDAAWEQEFFDQHGGRAPQWQDRLIRLFQVSFPAEWDPSAFYNAQGDYIEGSIERIFERDVPAYRSWDEVPRAMRRLAAWYTDQERADLNRDIGTLFGGLPDRIEEPNTFSAIRHPHNPVHAWVYVRPEGIGSYMLGADPDANIHHWAWGFTMGGAYGPGGTIINVAREELQFLAGLPQSASMADFWAKANNCRADMWIGSNGAAMGLSLRVQGADSIDRTWYLYMSQ